MCCVRYYRSRLAPAGSAVLTNIAFCISLYCSTCLPQDIFKRYLLSRIALRLLKIIGPRLVGQERTGNTQLLGYGSKHLGQNFFFYFIVLDRFFPEEPSLPRTGYLQTVATIQLVWCVPISTVFYYKRREKRLSNGPVYRA